MTTNLLFLSASLLAATALPSVAQNDSQVIDHVLEYSGTDITGRIDFTYDPDGRVTEILTQVPTAEGSYENSKKESYGYDDQGRRNVVEKLLWDETYEYWYANSTEDDKRKEVVFNDDNRPSEIFYYDEFDSNTETWGKQYNARGKFEYSGNKGTETRTKYKNGIPMANSATVINYTFDENRRITEKITNLSMDIDFDYEPENIPQDRFVYEYDDHGNVTLEKHFNNLLGDVEASWSLMYSYKFEYEYDADGNITRKKEFHYDDVEASYVLYSDLTYEYFYGSTVALDLPYYNDFGQAGSFDGFSTKDGNADGSSWALNGNGEIACTSTKASEEPDIVYLPAMNFSTEHEVFISMKAKAGDAAHPGQLQLILCYNDEEHTGMGYIGDIKQITGQEFTEITGRIVVEKNSPYVIGICFDNNQVGSTIVIDDIKVENGRSTKTPQSPFGLSATPASDGSLQVKLTWYPPTQDIAGNYLLGDDGYTVDNMLLYRDDLEEPLFETGKVGTSLAAEFIDTTVPEQGEYTYRVYAEVDGLCSDAAVVTLRVGYPVPGQITGFKVVENEDHSVTLSWDAPDAKDGDVKYWILRNNEEVEREFVGTSYTDRGIDTSAGQAYCYYMVQPYNEMGPAQATYSELLFVGEPNPVPFMESWAGGYGTYQWMNDEITLTADSQWGFGGLLEGSNVTPQDNDGGMAVFLSRNESEDATEVVRLTCEKIDLSSTTAPEMAFFMYHLTGEATGDAIVVEASTDNGEFKIMSDPIPVSGYATEGWTQHIIPLDGFTGEKNVRIGLRGISSGTHHIFIDNLMVGEKGCAGVEPVITGNTRIYSLNGEIIINAASESDIKVFSINGTQIYAGTATTANIPVAQGIYVVAINGQASKVIVK